ncbi:hypothetical protein KM043_002028 [Ampulex compressa]|nr:hypothetical protein KM043_002028 [Ampulex compressa]
MEEIQYKLNSKNPVLISHAISKLFDTIKEKANRTKKDNVSKIPEFQLLLSKCDDENSTLSISCSQALITLIENNLWDIPHALSVFTSSISCARNYAAFVAAMNQLFILHLKSYAAQDDQKSVCLFTLHTPQHPFITILNRDANNWRVVLDQMKYIINHPDPRIKDNYAEVLRPAFLYVICNPTLRFSHICKQQVWQLLIKLNNTSDEVYEALLWLPTHNADACIDTNCRIIELSEIYLLEHNKELCIAMLPMLASLALQLLKYGYDPRSNFETMSNIIELCSNYAGDIILTLMTEIIVLCPAYYLHSAMQVCLLVISKMSCGDLSLNMLVSSILTWMAYPSVLSCNALATAKYILDIIHQKEKLPMRCVRITSKLFSIFTHCDSNIRFYTELVCCMNSLTEEETILWLNNISIAPMDLKEKCKLVLCGLFLYSDNPDIVKQVCHVLIEIATEIKTFASSILSLILHKLTKSKDCYESKCLLLAIPELVIAKENVPIIIHTLDILLNSNQPLKYFAIQLYVKALEKDPRCYRFLSAALVQTLRTDHSWYSQVACAKAMKRICEIRPEHGEELVPLFSQILNRSVDINGASASALTLKSLSILCKAAVIGICSTWQVLAPKMKKEKRAVVLESLCELFGDVPHYPSQSSEEYDAVINDIITNLWTYAFCQEARVGQAALKALVSYRLELIPLKLLPSNIKCDLVLPKAYIKTPVDTTINPEDVLPYVPGSCWIQMLEKVNKDHLSLAGDILISYIKEEVCGFRSGIYVWPQGEPENFKYLSERSVIRAVGEYLRRSTKSDSKQQWIILECLRIFASKYPKPLPNINWNFLHETRKISDTANEYSLTIACRHAHISASAKCFVENHLLKYKSTSELDVLLQSRAYLVLYASLEELCQAIQPHNLKPFLEITLNYVIEKMTVDKEASKIVFADIMSSYAKTLKNESIHDTNNTLLSTILENLLDKIDLTCERFESYFNAALALSTKHVERMTSPSVWWEVTTTKLKNAIAVRCKLVLQTNEETPLVWMNEFIHTALPYGTEMYLLESVQRVQSKMRFKKSAVTWTLDFIARLQNAVAGSAEESINKINFYCDILFVTIISLSGVDCTLTRRDLIISSPEIRAKFFPQAVAILADRRYWSDIIPQLMEGFNYMRTNIALVHYKLVFHTALVSLRHKPYYKEAWTKYVSVKTNIST